MDGAEAAGPRAGALACAQGGEVGAAPQPAQAGAQARARAKRDYVRRAYCQKVATVARACRWIEAGWSVTDVCREPDMPQRSTFVAWLAAHPELRDMVEAARAAAAQVFTPRRAYHRWDPAAAAEVLARIEDGRGLREVCSEPDMPSAATVTRWLRARPAFAADYRRAREAQADRLFDLAWRIACEATEGEVATARLKIQTLKWRVGKLARRVYGPARAVAVAAADGLAAAGGDGADGTADAGTRRVVGFHARDFAVTPDNRVVETTGAMVGLDPEAARRLADDVRAGRIGLEELAARNAAGEAEMERAWAARDAVRGRRGARGGRSRR